MDRKLVAILVAGALVMGFTAWRAYPSRPPEIPKGDRRYMHCPKCAKESRYDEHQYEKDCAYCGQKGPLVATKESIRTIGVPSGPIARLLPPLLLEAILLGAVVLWYVHRRKTLSVEEDQLYTECSRCRQRLRYHAAKIGHLAQCPRCKRRFIFPALAPDDDEMRLRWWQPQWWRSRLKV